MSTFWTVVQKNQLFSLESSMCVLYYQLNVYFHIAVLV